MLSAMGVKTSVSHTPGDKLKTQKHTDATQIFPYTVETAH